MSENEPGAAALEAAHNITEFVDVMTYHEGNDSSWSAAELDYRSIARHFERYAAARVAEAVAAERARVAKTLFARRVIHEDNLQYVPLWVALDIVEGEERAKDEPPDDYARTDTPTGLVHWEGEE